MDNIWLDVKYGFRALNRNRGVIGIAILSLAIGIGANSAIFSVVDVFMVKPLPYPDSDRLYTLWISNEERGLSRNSFSAPDFIDLREESRALSLTATRSGTFNLSGDFEAQRLRGLYVTPEFFDILAVKPVMGRGFTPEEDVPGDEHVAVISQELWLTRFGGDPEIVGRTIVLDGLSHTVVGVTPPHFWYRFPDQDIFAPLAFTGEESRGSYYLNVLGRVNDGVTPQQAQEEADGILTRLAAGYPETSAGNGALLRTLHDDVFNHRFRSGSLISTVAVAFLLLIACANVANLLLTQAAGRYREVALRAALGAGRSRIIRQFLTEAVMVAGMGGVLGAGIAILGIRGLVRIMPPDFPRVHEIGLSPRVILITMGVTGLTGVLFGLAPALHSIRSKMTDSLKEGGRGGSEGRGGKLRKVLVVSEVGMALVLLVSSVLLVQGFRNVRLGDMGFEADNVLATRVLLPKARYPDTASVNDVYLALAARLEAIPGVEKVGGTSILPAQGNATLRYVLGDEDYGYENAHKIVSVRYLLPGYFEAMDIPLLKGRAFEASDRDGTQRIAVLNESFSRRHWPDGDAIGQRIKTELGDWEIVGVVADAREVSASGSPLAMVFLNALQTRREDMAWAIEASVPLGPLIPAVKAEIRTLDPTIAVYDVMPLATLIDEGMGSNLIMAKIMAVLAVIALVLALGGVYGVMAYSVSQRTQEMGIRMSLGADRGAVMRLVVGQGTVLALFGIGAGVGVALLVTRGLSFFLFGVNPFDPVTFITVSLALFGAGIGATILPAHRATRVDPAMALRAD